MPWSATIRLLPRSSAWPLRPARPPCAFLWPSLQKAKASKWSLWSTLTRLSIPPPRPAPVPLPSVPPLWITLWPPMYRLPRPWTSVLLCLSLPPWNRPRRLPRTPSTWQPTLFHVETRPISTPVATTAPRWSLPRMPVVNWVVSAGTRSTPAKRHRLLATAIILPCRSGLPRPGTVIGWLSACVRTRR